MKFRADQIQSHSHCLPFSNSLPKITPRICVASSSIPSYTFVGENTSNGRAASNPQTHGTCYVYVFDPISKTLRDTPKMSTGNCFPTTFVSDRKIYVLSAVRSSPENGEKLSWFEVFDPDSGEWTKLEDLPFKVRLSIERRLFCLGTMDCFVLISTGIHVPKSH